MTNDDDAPLTLTREDLYELVWSKPTVELAKDFGVSDVGLAKRCRKLGIPIPGRGYWARVDAGQTSYRPKLPKRKEKYHDTQALSLPRSQPVEEAGDTTGTGLGLPDDAERLGIRARIAAIEVTPSASVVEAHLVVKRTAWHLKHPRRGELTFGRGEKSGCVVPIAVSADALDRALLVADTLLRATEALGWSFAAPPPPPVPDASGGYGRRPLVVESAPSPTEVRGELLVDGERVAFQIEERYREEKCEPTAAELAREKREYRYAAPRKIREATGKLRIVRLDTYGAYGGPVRQTWYDRKGRRIEDQLKDVLIGFHELSLSSKSRRKDDERKAREHAETAKRQEELEARQAASTKLIEQLEADAGAWHRARFLRRYIRAARRRLAAALSAKFMNSTVSFFDWAEEYVNQLDPLHPRPRAEDFESDDSGHHSSGRAEDSLARLLGNEWEVAYKIGADYSPKPRTAGEWMYSYEEKSVFEVDDGGREED
jgi:hypothetical protein